MDDAIITIEKYKYLFGKGKNLNLTDVKTNEDFYTFISKINQFNSIIIYGGFEFERTFDYSKMSEEEIISKVWVLNLFLTEKYVEKNKNMSCLLTNKTIIVEEKESIVLSEKRHDKSIDFFKDHLNELIISNVPINKENFELLFRKKINEYDILYLI